MKKIFLFFVVVATTSIVFAEPKISCWTLPGCSSTWSSVGQWFLVDIITSLIEYTAVIAVLALMLSGLMYMMSAWEEEKTKKAKNWIMWSLIWVVVSLLASWLVRLIAGFSSDVGGTNTIEGLLGFARNSLFEVLMVIGIAMALYFWARLAMARWNQEEFKKVAISFVYVGIGIFIVSVSWAVVRIISGINL